MNTEITQAQIDAYQTNGFVVMDEFLTPEELETWRDVVDQAVRERKDRKLVVEGAVDNDRWKDDGSFYDYVFVQRLNLWKDNPAVKELILDPRIGRMATELAQNGRHARVARPGPDQATLGQCHGLASRQPEVVLLLPGCDQHLDRAGRRHLPQRVSLFPWRVPTSRPPTSTCRSPRTCRTSFGSIPTL